MDDESLSTSIAEHESYRHSRDRTDDAIKDSNFIDDLYPNQDSETEIHFSDVDAKPYQRFGKTYYNKWAYLDHVDSGMNDSSRKQQNRNEGIRRDVNTFLDHLSQERNISDYHERRVKHIINSLDSLNFGGVPYEVTILAIISLVLDEEVNTTNDVQIRTTDSWKQLLIDTDVTKSQVKNIRTKTEVREKL